MAGVPLPFIKAFPKKELLQEITLIIHFEMTAIHFHINNTSEDKVPGNLVIGVENAK